MGRGWRPLVVGAAVVVATFALAQAQIFAPSAPAEPGAVGDAAQGQAIFTGECASANVATTTAAPTTSGRHPRPIRTRT